MRVAIISEVFLPKIDGVVNRTLNLLRHLPTFGDELMLICPHSPGRPDIGIPVVEIPSFSFPPYPEYHIGMPTPELADQLRRFRPDVLHYVNPFAFGFRCHDVLQSAGLDTPTVFSFHTVYGEFVKQYKSMRPLSMLLWWIMREYHNRADANLTVSTLMLDELVDRGFERVTLWPPAVNTDLYQPSHKGEAMRARLTQGRPEKKLLLTVSRLAPEKNVAFLGEVLERVPNATLAIIGDGPERPALERRFQGLDVNFVGYLKGEALASAYASSDAFVYASETETMGNVVLEAMACACPVIAPRAGGIPSLLTHGQTGFLYTPRDADEAARYTNQALHDNATREQMIPAAQAWVQGRGWAGAIGKVREVYQQAIETRQRPGAPMEVELKFEQRLARLTLGGLVQMFKLSAAGRTKPKGAVVEMHAT